ncbi:NADH-quinone oxidoreductase subunit NuoN [Oxalobacter sp. OttesenSCG-928-P03]|nr:NADH-quinone oxidoreductase subunit NuoN [Oxalobacter sp. OttesenSCG-928-P03]
MNGMNLVPAYPEIALLLSTLGILVIDMFLPRGKRIVTWVLSLFAVLLCAGLCLRLLSATGTTYTFEHMFVSDPLSGMLKLCTCLAMFATLLYSRCHIDERGMTGGFIGGEFYILALFSMLGQMIVISGANFLVLYLGVELMSLPLYALVAMRRNDIRVSEAAIKYFILGMLGSGFFLYGISMLYGATGTLELAEMLQACTQGDINETVLVFGVVFVVAGMAFKLGVAPFHMWVPDVYEGAPTPVTLLIGGMPKLAAFALFFRMLVEGMWPLAFSWQQMLMVMAVLSMLVGNITALRQTNLKRMLAYSGIAHGGFILLGMLSGVFKGAVLQHTVNGWSAALFYAVAYVLVFSGAIGLILAMSRSGFEAEQLDDMRGLNKRSPWLAFIMLLFMLSMTGLPPLIGFYAKLSVLQAVIAADRVWLAIVAIVLSVVGAFYYLNVVRLMYFEEPADTEKIIMPVEVRIMLALNGLAVLILGILPGNLMNWCESVIYRALSHSLSEGVIISVLSYS